jgi:hypothetical protein
VVASGDASAPPQSPQKRLPGGLSAPHLGQRFVNSAPQSPQNLFPVGFVAPTFRTPHQLTRGAAI